MSMNLIVSCSSKKKEVLIKTYWSYDSIWYGTKNSFPIINDMEKISDLKFIDNSFLAPKCIYSFKSLCLNFHSQGITRDLIS